MSELPFTVEQFFQVFEAYNESVWPAHFIGYGLGIWALFLAVSSKKDYTKFVNRILAVFWVWMGIMYHMVFFSTINSAAYVFGALFVIQGAGFLILNHGEQPFRFAFKRDAYGISGLIMIVYAMALYPILGYFMGHTYPQAPVFGVSPCPTVIFTFGLLLWTDGRIPNLLPVIPALWSLLGFSAAWQLGVYEDFGLVIAGIWGTGMILYRNHRLKTLKQSRPISYEA